MEQHHPDENQLHEPVRLVSENDGIIDHSPCQHDDTNQRHHTYGDLEKVESEHHTDERER
jgi:hypothetical protein